MKTVYHPANERGHVNHGWLNARHSFSFGSWNNPAKTHFGVLRVLNDDIVQGGQGFGAHPHDNMEIITIPLTGALEHNDNTGRNEIIKSGDVQMMSAGTGIVHSEYNASETEPINLLQVWVFPKKRNIVPKYQQITFNKSDFDNKLRTVVSPNETDAVLTINQDAWFSIGELKKDSVLQYQINKKGNGVYVFVIEGKADVNDNIISKRDGLGIWDTDTLILKALEDSRVLLMEVPMELN